MANPTRVLIVDDSPLIRALLTEIIEAEPDMTVVGVAEDPYAAREKIKELNPDVLTLDVELPRMNGLEFLERLMRLRPMPVVMVSSLTGAGAATTLRALELGAVDFVLKPSIDVKDGMHELAADLTEKLRAAAGAQVRRYVEPPPQPRAPVSKSPAASRAHAQTEDVLIAIGASTGGTEALKEVLIRMPRSSPPIVIAQHMPPGFTKSFAERLDRICEIDVHESEGGEQLQWGHAYIAPGSAHLRVVRRGATGYTQLDDGALVNRHRPSVDVLFRSVAATYGKRGLGVILTGMGKDGAVGLAEMHAGGSFTVAQNEASCVVFGMPKAAIDIGGVSKIAPLIGIADVVLRQLGIAR